MDNFGYREMGWPSPLQTPAQTPTRSPQSVASFSTRFNLSNSSRVRDPEEFPLRSSFKNVRNIDLLESARDPNKAKEYLFVGPAPPADDAPNMYQSFDILAPDPEARLSEDVVRRALCERALTLGAGRFFDDLECGLITAENIEEHICSAPEVVVNLTLLWAAFLTRDELLPTILEVGADIHFSEPLGLTALHIAAFSGASRSVSYLISMGADVDFVPKYFSPLHCAAFGNSLECAEILIASGSSLHAVVQRAGCEDNLVHCAVRNDALECMELFIEKGVDPAYITSGGLNALHLAAELGAQRCLLYLLKGTKISVNCVTKQRDKECTALHLAATRGYAECVEILLAEGAKANTKNHRGFTALHLAARCSSLETVEVLLRDGNADPNAEDSDKRTPLHAAVCRSERSGDIIDMLVSWGADVNRKDEYGYSALHLAALDGLTLCVETLLILGADVTSKSKKGHTALSVIVRKTPKSLTILKHNLDSGISISSAEGNEEVQIEFNFGKFLKYSYPREITYLNSLIDEGQKDILQHPLCSAFLFMKWKKIRKFYLARLIFCFLFVSFLSIYVLTTVVKTCKGKYSKKYGIPNELCQPQSLLGDILEDNPIEFERWVLIAITAFEIVRKLTGITGYSSIYQYFTTVENLMEWFVLLSVFSLYNIQHDYGWQNHVGGYAVVGAWTNLMLMMGQLPMFGDYVAMYQKVLKEFLKLLLAYICLLLGFAICFCVVFPNEEMFSNPLMGFISILSMMVGELNLNILINDPLINDDPPLIFELSAQIIFILFLMFVTIILMNLLVGIAVHDIQGLRKTAGLSKLVRQTKLILFVEMGMFSAWLPKCLHKYVYRTALVSPEAGKVILSVKPLNPNEKRLPTDIMMAAYELAQLNKLKSGRSVKEMLHKNKNNKHLSQFKNEQTPDHNFNMEIRGMQEKIDQTTFNLKKIDQEMRHLKTLLMEQHSLLQSLFKCNDRSYSHSTQYYSESPVFFASNASDVTSITKLN